MGPRPSRTIENEEVLAVRHRYEGPFLDGEDAEWILEERERLHSLFIQSAMIMVRHPALWLPPRCDPARPSFAALRSLS